MNLTSHDIDLLTEVANIGGSRAVSRLSLLLHDDIDFINPDVMYLGREEATALFKSIPKNKPHITQKLSGIIEGVANLLFEESIAPLLLERLFAEALKEHRLGIELYEREALQEVTNIITATYFASLANLCEGEITMSVPIYLPNKTIDECLPTLNTGKTKDSSFVIMNSEIRIHRKKMGNLIVVLTTNSSKTLINTLMNIVHNKTQITS